jgi:putative peptide zinc metalloprotease protein
MAAPFLSSSWHRVERLRPKLREHASVNRQRFRGNSWYVVQDRATGRTFRLPPASYMIVGSMDGTRTVDQLWREAAACLGDEAPSQDDLIRLLGQLSAADLLQTEVTPDSAALLERAASAQRSLWLRNILNPMSLRVRLWHPDKFFERTSSLARLLFGWHALALWIVVVAPAIVLAGAHWQALSVDATERILAADNILMIVLTFPVLKVLHELGHAYAVKAFGGVVHEIGLMFIVFAPMPYVDASAASQFRSKWKRAVVGAAGMMIEIFVAALALYVWLVVEPGLVQTLAYNVMLIAGVATVLFNGNPLLRFDGYYILSDLAEIPNLASRATRYWRYLVDRHVFQAEGTEDLDATRAERIWLLFYAPASFLYRIAVMLAIALFIASEYLVVGIAIAVWGLITSIAMPIGKALWQVIASPRYHRNRTRVVATTTGSVLAISIALFWVPAPLYTTTEGVVWLPESANVRAATNGFVRRLMVEPGRAVSSGDALIEAEEPTLSAELQILQARVSELEATLTSERFTDRAKAVITATELEQARAELATATVRADRLVVRSQGEGIFAVSRPQDLPGRFMKEGQQIGYVLPAGSRIVRATIRQDDIDLVRNRLRQASVKLAERLDEALPARIIREVPAGRDDLPSKALGGTGGGALPVDPRDPQGMKTFQRVFQVDIELPFSAAAATAFGSRAYVRFDHHWEPIGQQIWRRGRQLVLSRLHT